MTRRSVDRDARGGNCGSVRPGPVLGWRKDSAPPAIAPPLATSNSWNATLASSVTSGPVSASGSDPEFTMADALAASGRQPRGPQTSDQREAARPQGRQAVHPKAIAVRLCALDDPDHAGSVRPSLRRRRGGDHDRVGWPVRHGRARNTAERRSCRTGACMTPTSAPGSGTAAARVQPRELSISLLTVRLMGDHS
jgi:hypothetical protein